MDERGHISDANAWSDDVAWLKTAIVTHAIRAERGRFWIDMIFTAADDPLKKLIRPINHYPSYKRAEWHANILQRQLRADPRDPLPKLPPDADDIRRN